MSCFRLFVVLCLFNLLGVFVVCFFAIVCLLNVFSQLCGYFKLNYGEFGYLEL